MNSAIISYIFFGLGILGIIYAVLSGKNKHDKDSYQNQGHDHRHRGGGCCH